MENNNQIKLGDWTDCGIYRGLTRDGYHKFQTSHGCFSLRANMSGARKLTGAEIEAEEKRVELIEKSKADFFGSRDWSLD